MESSDKKLENLIHKLRATIDDYIKKYQYDSAAYWTEKLVTLSNGDVNDIYLYSQVLYLTGQYSRAIGCLNHHGFIKKSAACRYLAAQCYMSCQEYTAAMEVLTSGETVGSDSFIKAPTTTGKHGMSMSPLDEEIDRLLGVSSNKIESSISLLKGRILEAMDNRVLAVECYEDALRQDVMCYEAFEKLVRFQMLTEDEEDKLIASLNFSDYCGEEVELIDLLYKNKLKKFATPDDIPIPDWLDCLHSNNDIIVSVAERYLHACDYQECYKITSRIMKRDPYNSSCLPIHIAVLKELKKSNELYYLAQQLMKMYPKVTISWFAVGCYYLTINKNELARRYFMKATQLDRQFGPAWLALGHAFAADKEHDQAIASYCTASQVMKGCHIPVLYMGMEYGLSSNRSLAERFLLQAHSICEQDPFVLHEIGTLAYEGGKYNEALEYFQKAHDISLQLCNSVHSQYWEPLLNNMAHTHRKLGNYKDSLALHRKALSLIPDNPCTLSAIGLVLALSDQLFEAIDYLHRALAIKRDDGFSSTLLTTCVDLITRDQNNSLGRDIPTTVPSMLPTLLDDSNKGKDSFFSNSNISSDILNAPPSHGLTVRRNRHKLPISLRSGAAGSGSIPLFADDSMNASTSHVAIAPQTSQHVDLSRDTISDVSMDLDDT